MRKKKFKADYRRIVLRLPDLDHSKVQVLNSLTSSSSRRVYIGAGTGLLFLVLGVFAGFLGIL